PVPLDFMIEITAAVRRGAPLAFVVADMPFGSYAPYSSEDAKYWPQCVESVFRMVKLSRCDCVKMEVAAGHAELVKTLADSGVAVMAHLGLRPQSVGLLGGYKFQGRTASEAEGVLALALQMQRAGAAAILLEAVPPEVSQRVVEETSAPVIGCGAGSACHGSVIVTHDAVGLTTKRPRFVPTLGDFATPMREAFSRYVEAITTDQYPAAEHQYEMPAEEREKFERQKRAADERR